MHEEWTSYTEESDVTTKGNNTFDRSKLTTIRSLVLGIKENELKSEGMNLKLF